MLLTRAAMGLRSVLAWGSSARRSPRRVPVSGMAGGSAAAPGGAGAAAGGAGVGNGRRVGGAAVADGGAQQVFAGFPAAVEHGLAGPGAGGDGVDGEVLVALGGQLLPCGVEDRLLEPGDGPLLLRVPDDG